MIFAGIQAQKTIKIYKFCLYMLSLYFIPRQEHRSKERTQETQGQKIRKITFIPCLTALTLWKPSRRFTQDSLWKSDRLQVQVLKMKMLIIRFPGGFQDFWSPVVSMYFLSRWRSAPSNVVLLTVCLWSVEETEMQWDVSDHHFLETHSIMTITALCRGEYCDPGSVLLVTGYFFSVQVTWFVFKCGWLPTPDCVLL